LLDMAFARRVEALVARAGLPVRWPATLGCARTRELMQVDKKAEGGAIRFVLLDGPSHAIVRTAPHEMLYEALGELGAPP
ncbi:MAG TPA: 3-dehydroquinate synthase, partial [Burkholderiaceae bacterium]|nr:3-dehydroquinate synthase [Burkholderiaceae bacterium]